MPENSTLEEVIERLNSYIKVAEKINCKCIASIWLSDAQVIYNTLIDYVRKEKDYGNGS